MATELLPDHSHLQSSWAGIDSSGFVQHQKSEIPIKPGKTDWLSIWNKHSAHAQKIRSGQSFWSLLQARVIMSSSDENAAWQN